jgi:MFS family permease
MALYPFLTLHMKSLGISLVEIGVQFAITPLAVLIATPLIGLLADRIGNFRWMIVMSLLLSALVGQLILYVPKVKQVSICTLEQQRFRFTCPNSIEGENERDDFFMLQIPSCFGPASTSGASSGRAFTAGIHNLQFTQCAVVCKNKTLPTHLQQTRSASSDSSAVWWDPPTSALPSYCLHSEEKHVEHCMTPTWDDNQFGSETLAFNVSLNGAQVRLGSTRPKISDASVTAKSTIAINSALSSSTAQAIPSTAFSPSSASSASVIVSATPGASVTLVKGNQTAVDTANLSNASLDTSAQSLPIASKNDQIDRPVAASSTSESAVVEQIGAGNILPSTSSESARSLTANPIDLLEGVITSIERDPARSSDSLRHYQTIRCNSELREDCHISCAVQPSSQLPSLTQQTVDDPFSHHLTFWLYLLFRILLSMIIATEMSMLKAAILTLVNKHDSEYGFQRMWASLSVAFVPLCIGYLMDRLIESGDSQTFSPCFYVFGAFKVLMALICVFVNLDVKAPSIKVWNKLGKLLQRPEVSLFLFFCGLIGCVWGFIETFIAWFLEELHASRTLIGFNITVAAVVGMPFNLFAGRIEKRFGHVPIIIFGIFVYAVRCVGYSFATEAYHVIMFEVLDGITSTLLIVTMTTYASKLSSTDLIATMQAAWAAMHFSVGRSLGSMVGGLLMQSLGPSLTYLVRPLFSGSFCLLFSPFTFLFKSHQTFAFISTFFGIVYIFVYVFYLRSRIQQRIDDEKREKGQSVNYFGHQSKIAFSSNNLDPTGALGLVKGKAVSMDQQIGLNNNLDHLADRNVYGESKPIRKSSTSYSAY